MIKLNAERDRLIFSDDDIQTEIWQDIRMHKDLLSLDLGSFSVSVKDAVVLITGHVSKKYHRELIKNIAYAIPVINAVHCSLIVDSDLMIEVARRLSIDERVRPFILPVSCAHGWIHLGGEVPSHELQIAAEEIAGGVPFVRGVLSRPKVVGERPETERRAVQPQIHAKTYDFNRQEGMVTQVVIQPRNRLVTHAVISASDFRDGKFVHFEYLVPVEAMEVVTKESIILKRNGPPLNAFPSFETSIYPLAPSNWQPPYPYAGEAVRWSCE